MKRNIYNQNIYFLFFVFLISIYSSDSHVDSCTITNGVFDKTQVIDNAGYCASAPDLMKLLLMKCIFAQQLQLHPQHLRRWD